MKYRATINARPMLSLGAFERRSVHFIAPQGAEAVARTRQAIETANAAGLEVQNVMTVVPVGANGNKTLGDLCEELLCDYDRITPSEVTIIAADILQDKFFILAKVGNPVVVGADDSPLFMCAINSKNGFFIYRYGDAELVHTCQTYGHIDTDARRWFNLRLQSIAQPRSVLGDPESFAPELLDGNRTFTPVTNGDVLQLRGLGRVNIPLKINSDMPHSERHLSVYPIGEAGDRRAEVDMRRAADSLYPNGYRRQREPGYEWSVNLAESQCAPFVFRAEQHAELFIDSIEKWYDSAGVNAGAYSLDGPNEMGDEFADPALTPEEKAEGAKEGWVLSRTHGSNPPEYQLQKLDDPASMGLDIAPLESDRAAWVIVFGKPDAAASPLHLKVRAWLKEHSPVEYARIIRHMAERKQFAA